MPIGLDEAWSFFATPLNLNELVDKSLGFKVISELPAKMYEGLIITYKIHLYGLPMNWCTEITHIKENIYFIDEQRKGPYRMWHHEHHFEAVKGGVLMTDLLFYDIGKWAFGWAAGKLFVDRKVREIFDHRYKVLEKRFAKH